MYLNGKYQVIIIEIYTKLSKSLVIVCQSPVDNVEDCEILE